MHGSRIIAGWGQVGGAHVAQRSGRIGTKETLYWDLRCDGIQLVTDEQRPGSWSRIEHSDSIRLGSSHLAPDDRFDLSGQGNKISASSTRLASQLPVGCQENGLAES